MPKWKFIKIKKLANSIGMQNITSISRVCLFGGEIGWMENFGEKIGRETFLECVWLGEEEGK